MTIAQDDADAKHKVFATLQARAALRRVVLHKLDCPDGSGHLFLAAQGQWSRDFTDLAEVERWLDRIEGRAA